jgi:hypothetical protein
MKKLALTLAIFVALYSVTWCGLTHHFQQQSESFLTSLNNDFDNLNVAFDKTEKFGFPFRLGVRFKNLRFDTTLGDFHIKSDPKGYTQDFSTTLLAKAYTISESGSDKLFISTNNKPTLTLETDGSHSISLGMKKSLLWSSFTSDQSDSFMSIANNLKEAVENCFHDIEAQLSAEGDNKLSRLTNIENHDSLLKKLLPALAPFEFYKFEGKNSILRYIFSKDTKLPSGIEHEGILSTSKYLSNEIIIDQAETDQAKITFSSKDVDTKENIMPLVFLFADIDEKKAASSEPGFQKSIHNYALPYIKEPLLISQSNKLAEITGNVNKETKFSIETSKPQAENRLYKLNFMAYDESNNISNQSGSGYIGITLGQNPSFKTDLNGVTHLKSKFKDMLITMFTTENLQDILGDNNLMSKDLILYTSNLIKEMAPLFDGIENVGAMTYKLKASAETKQPDFSFQDFSIKIDDFSIKTPVDGGFKMEGKLNGHDKKQRSDGSLKLIKFDTMFDTLSKRVVNLINSALKIYDNKPKPANTEPKLDSNEPKLDKKAPLLNITDNTIKNAKAFLKKLNTLKDSAEDNLITFESGNEFKISGKDLIEIIMLWYTISTGINS